MVQKKSNCHNVNSGNTMRKRCYSQVYLKKTSQTTHVIKYLKNSRFTADTEKQHFEVDPADSYVEDGGLQVCSDRRHRNTWAPLIELYSLNKKRRWLLEEVVAAAVEDKELKEELFKISLVHRTVPCHGGQGRDGGFFTVARYYDSKMDINPMTPTCSLSSRQDLLEKGSLAKERVDKRSQRKSRRRQGHNQHFRGVQKKRSRASLLQENAEVVAEREDDVPEIRYEIGVAEKLNSASFKNCWNSNRYYGFNYPRTNGFRLRGPNRVNVAGYFADLHFHGLTKKGWSNYVAGLDGDHFCEEDGDVEALWDAEELSIPAEEEFSLLDFAMATKKKRHQTSKGKHRWATQNSDASQINPASHQQVKKYGKGSAIFIEREKMAEDSDVDLDLDLTQTLDTDEDMEDHSLQEASSDSQRTLPIKIDYETEFSRFDRSFCSCRILQSEFNSFQLRSVFGCAVEFGNCIPVTARFDVHAASVLLRSEGMKEDEKTNQGDWWLLCQVGERLTDQFSSSQHTQEDVVIVNLKLYSSLDDSSAASANLELQNLVSDDDHSVYLSMATLLLRVFHMLEGLQLSRNNSSKQSHTTSTPTATSLSYEPPSRQVTVCTVSQAYQHLKAAGKISSTQVHEDVDLDSTCNLTWCGIQCAVCFTSFDSEDTTLSVGSFCPFVVTSTCGHCFCRQCWQHHFVCMILDGQTNLKCMEFKCETTIDPTTLMSLVPQWAYTRWQQHLHNAVVESSGEWTWCPNPRCDLLATSQSSRNNAKLEKRGVTVACACQKQWCLDCSKDAHWPISCQQFNTYTKMLKQRGDEDGMKSVALEIAYVHVKRCPGCNYPMEKNGGCSHMFCPRCSKSFCWECLRDWRDHSTGNWTGCTSKKMETIELDNEKLYPLPIECYKKAVSFRYKWKHLQTSQHKNLKVFTQHFMYMKRVVKGRRRGSSEGPPDHAVDLVMEAFVFLSKGLSLLELSYILLSNTSKHHSLAKPLRSDLDLLHFICERVSWRLFKPTRNVLMSSVALHRIAVVGSRLMQQIQRCCRHLAFQTQDTNTQEWLLTTDHEKFVHYK